MKKINKELQQKWHNFTHPTKIEHYGYVFSEKDLRQFPEGRAVLCIRAKMKFKSRKIDKIIQSCGRMFANKIDNMILECLSSN